MKHWLDEIKQRELAKKAEVPSQLWQSLIPHLPKAKNKNNYWLILLMSGIFVGGIGAALMVYQNNSISEITANGAYKNTVDKTESVSGNSIELEQSEVKNSINTLKPIKYNTGNRMQKKTQEVTAPIESTPLVSLESQEQPNEIRRADEVSTLERKKGDLTFDKVKLNLGDPIDCYDFANKKKPKYFLEIYVGPLYGFQRLKASQAEVSEWKNRREDTESNRLSYLAGIRTGVMYRNLIFKVGFEYQQLYGQLNYEKSRDTQIINVIQNNVLVRTDTITGRTVAKIHNYHRVYQIPISIGYTRRINNNSISLHLGAAFNLRTTHKGGILDGNNTFQRFNEPLEVYKSRIGISPFVSAQWTGKWKPRINYFIEPSVQFYPKMNVSNFPIREKNISPNLKFGLQFLLR